MVSTKRKKTAKKDEGTTETIEPVVIPKPEPLLKATFTTDYTTLLESAPAVPYISSIEDAVKFVDEYAKWKAKVKAAT